MIMENHITNPGVSTFSHIQYVFLALHLSSLSPPRLPPLCTPRSKDGVDSYAKLSADNYTDLM